MHIKSPFHFEKGREKDKNLLCYLKRTKLKQKPSQKPQVFNLMSSSYQRKRLSF